MSHKRKVLLGSSSNLVRVLLSTLVALVLPPFLVHRLSPAAYAAWVLILQLSAYVNFFDLGLQTAIGKFVAEYDASGNAKANRSLVSTSFTMLSAAAALGAVLVLVLAWRTPQLFHQMPGSLIPEVRLGLLAVGLSTALALPFTIFLGIFTGLQQYVFPAAIIGGGRVASAAGLVLLLLLHGSLVQLAFLLAAFNVAIALTQFIGWKKFASERVGFSFFAFDRGSAARLAKYGWTLTIWTLATLFISGLDTLIVGRYDFKNTGFYAIASTATNFMLVVISSVFSPLLPAVSAMQSGSTSGQIGEVVIRTTRYCVLLLCLLGLPILFGAYPLLTLWVGHNYAARSALFLEILILGNVVRLFGYPYALVVVATGKQHLATIAALSETVVNIALSIWLVQKMGAVGVAIGTLAGAFVSIGMHLAISMHYTRSTIFIRRSHFVLQGVLRPLSGILPSLLLYPFWRRSTMIPANPTLLTFWAAATVAIIWSVGMRQEERLEFKQALSRLLYWRSERA